MKYLLVLAVVLIAVHVWRSNRKASSPPRKPAAKAGAPEDMVRCATCSVHLPRADALAGSEGFYCSDEHRLRAGS